LLNVFNKPKSGGVASHAVGKTDTLDVTIALRVNSRSGLFLATGSDLRWRYKRPSVTIRVSNESFGAKIIFPWLLDNPVTSFASFFDHSGSVADVEMGIHAKPELFAVTARFFPIPPAVPEEHADVVRFELATSKDGYAG
jgi:hypothetical protein